MLCRTLSSEGQCSIAVKQPDYRVNMRVFKSQLSYPLAGWLSYSASLCLTLNLWVIKNSTYVLKLLWGLFNIHKVVYVLCFFVITMIKNIGEIGLLPITLIYENDWTLHLHLQISATLLLLRKLRDRFLRSSQMSAVKHHTASIINEVTIWQITSWRERFSPTGKMKKKKLNKIPTVICQAFQTRGSAIFPAAKIFSFYLRTQRRTVWRRWTVWQIPFCLCFL